MFDIAVQITIERGELFSLTSLVVEVARKRLAPGTQPSASERP